MVGAKKHFIENFQRANRDLRVFVKDCDVPEEHNTPRRQYLRATTKMGLLPLPLVLRKPDPTGKRQNEKGIFLAHKVRACIHAPTGPSHPPKDPLSHSQSIPPTLSSYHITIMLSY